MIRFPPSQKNLRLLHIVRNVQNQKSLIEYIQICQMRNVRVYEYTLQSKRLVGRPFLSHLVHIIKGGMVMLQFTICRIFTIFSYGKIAPILCSFAIANSLITFEMYTAYIYYIN